MRGSPGRRWQSLDVRATARSEEERYAIHDMGFDCRPERNDILSQHGAQKDGGDDQIQETLSRCR